MIGSFDALWSVALDDLDTAEWIANLGITLFALPLVVFGAVGGRLAQRVGPFRVGAIGLLLGAGVHDRSTGSCRRAWRCSRWRWSTRVSDGLTMSSTGVAVGMVVPATARPAPRACSAGPRR